MKGPIKSVLWIHNAILKETRTFEDAVHGLPNAKPDEASALLEQFRFFRKVLEFHEGSEDQTIFPVLEERVPHVAETYDLDHQRQQARYAEIEASLQALAATDNGNRGRLVDELSRQAEGFAVTMELHVAKENELLYPLYDQTFSVEEQKALEAKGMQEHPPQPEFMGQVLPWMFRLQTVDDREGLARFFLGMFPPHGRPALVGMLSGGVTPDEWAEVVRRVPDLAS